MGEYVCDEMVKKDVKAETMSRMLPLRYVLPLEIPIKRL